MTKDDAIKALGGTQAAAARWCRITPSAVSQWPAGELPERIERTALAGLMRKQMAHADSSARPQETEARPADDAGAVTTNPTPEPSGGPLPAVLDVQPAGSFLAGV